MKRTSAVRDAKKVLDHMPEPCGGSSCTDARCAELTDLRAQVVAAGDNYARLVASYENKVQDLARETLLRAELLNAVRALQAANRRAMHGDPAGVAAAWRLVNEALAKELKCATSSASQKNS